MLKVVTCVGTRPELIKMSRVIAELDKQFHHILIHSGQNYDYELNQIFFDELEIRKPDYFLGAAAENPVKFIANILSSINEVLVKENPDAILFYGDTNTCMAVIAAKRQQIPVFHMEAGNRCFDQRVPEELNRKVIDHLSDINLVLTDQAKNYLITEGVSPESIVKTGSHMEEVLDYFMPKIVGSSILKELSLTKGEYFLVSLHREENVDHTDKLTEFIQTLEGIADHYNFPIIVSTHPRTRKMLEQVNNSTNDHVRFVKPFGFIDYIMLQLSSFCILSDSGTIMEEASLLNLPAVTIRDAHERPEGMDEGVLVMAPLNKSRIFEAINMIVDQHNSERPVKKIVPDYRGGAVSKQVARVVLSYIDYINRTVWHKA